MMGLEDESEQFSLRWNNFHSNLTAGFHDLLEEEDLVDVTLACDGQFVQAHKIVLSVCSPYFKTLFKANPCKHPIVILKDVGHKELQAILQFMYRGEVNVRQDDLTSFLKTAEMLKIKGLTGDNDKPERSSPKQQQQQRRPAPEERPERPKPVQPKEEPPPPIPQQHSQPPSPAVPYKRMRTEPPPRPPTPPSPDTNDDDIEFLEVTKPKIEPPDYSQDEYSSEGPSKVMSDDQASNHLSTESAGHSGQTSDTIVPSMSMISSQLQITPVEQDTIDSKASLSLPHSSSLEPSVSLQSPMSKEGIPGMFASVSGLSQDSNSQDGSQGDKSALKTSIPLICTACNKEFSSYANLYKHVKRLHTLRRYRCPACSKTFSATFDLRFHVRLKHREVPDGIVNKMIFTETSPPLSQLLNWGSPSDEKQY